MIDPHPPSRKVALSNLAVLQIRKAGNKKKLETAKIKRKPWGRLREKDLVKGPTPRFIN